MQVHKSRNYHPMKPVAIIPMNDPNGLLFPHLKAITPALKELFGCVFVSVPPTTRKALPKYIEWLDGDDFYDVTYHNQGVSIGDDFVTLYAHAASVSAPKQILHLCFIDRVAFALQSEHQGAFVTDIQDVRREQMPLIFRRSAKAWQTHPTNYYELEHMVTRVGEMLFEKSLDFAWCHIAIQANQLQKVIAQIQRRDMSFFAEMVLAMIDTVKTREVDWLSWEDPFILSKADQKLKVERETSIEETHKRLAYVIPMLQLLDNASKVKLD